MFSLEDAYVAGRFAAELVPGRERRRTELNDAAIATFELARHYGEKWRRAVLSSAAARDLKRLGFKKDIDAATEVDSHTVVPVYSERLITAHD
jgi:phosphosulfolactate phosphohydrolase-like enzyme